MPKEKAPTTKQSPLDRLWDAYGGYYLAENSCGQARFRKQMKWPGAEAIDLDALGRRADETFRKLQDVLLCDRGNYFSEGENVEARIAELRFPNPYDLDFKSIRDYMKAFQKHCDGPVRRLFDIAEMIERRRKTALKKGL
jgi:hypothetical protein